MVSVLRDGHSGSVLCCDVIKDGSGRILTGGECGEICLWSADAQKQGKVVVEDGESDVTSIFTLKHRSDLFYSSYGTQIALYDTRQFNAPIETITINEEEINQVTLNDKEDFLASCDDSGNIKIYSLMNKTVFKTLRKHSNICASVLFRPKRPWDLFSGGYDQRLIQWDFSRGKAVCDINIQEVGITPDKFDSYTLNPPFIHSIALSPNGAFLACGTENAIVQVFNSSKRTLSFVKSLKGHTQGVSQVHFPSFVDNVLISGGNDGVCNIWKLDDLTSEHQSNGYHHQNGVSSSNHVENSNAASNYHSAANNHAGDSPSSSPSNAEENSSENSSEDNPPEEPVITYNFPCYGIQHTEKVNWITSGSTANRKFIIVADSTSEPTIYDYPDT